MYLVEEDGKKQLKVEAHFGKRKALAAIRTCCSHVQVSLGPNAQPQSQMYSSSEMWI